MISRLKDKLAGDGSCIACWSGFQDPHLAALIAQQDYDAIVLDAQHGFHDENSIANCIPRIVSAGKSPIVRIPLNRWDFVERALDFGALGIVAPMINTGKDAERFVKAVKYPSIGARSYSPRHAAALYGAGVDEYLHASQDCTLAFAQIETKEAYDNLDDILAVKGLDGILMGPADFSIFVTGKTVPDVYGPGTIELVEDIAKRTRKAGKHAAAFTATPEHANQCYDFGYRLISVAMDGSIIPVGASASIDQLKF